MKIIIYTFLSPPTRYMLNRLCKELKIDAVILQTPFTFIDKTRFIKNRLRKQGFFRVCDEILFQVYYYLLIKRNDARLSWDFFPKEYLRNKVEIDKNIPVYNVSSINSKEARALLSRIAPDIVFMQSREMVCEDVLKFAKIGFIGCHPGILPEYRGAYAPFWAVLNLGLDKLGFTVYLADKGIDTGKTIFSKNVDFDISKGSFKFHSEYIMFESVKFIVSALNKIQAEGISFIDNRKAKGRLYSHIGISDYFFAKKKLSEFMKYKNENKIESLKR